MSAELFFLLLSAIYIAPNLSPKYRNFMGVAYAGLAAVVVIGKEAWRYFV